MEQSEVVISSQAGNVGGVSMSNAGLAGSGSAKNAQGLALVSSQGTFFVVQLEDFEGPIDLLLHLVKKNELPIEGLSLAQVAEQFLSCIEAMRMFDLEIAGEYLVIAATLISVKSAVLLNKPADIDLNLELGESPQEELLRRLREAAVYREGAGHLAQRSLLGIDVFAPPSQLADIEAPVAAFAPHDPLLLGKAFKKLLDRVGIQAAVFTITFDAVSIVDRMVAVMEKLDKAGGMLRFSDITAEVRTRAEAVSFFIALLELCKRQTLIIKQDEADGEVLLARSGAAFSAEGLVSEFDIQKQVV